jgi:hypothetical protein
MEIQTGGVIAVLLIIWFVATAAACAILKLLDSLKIIRFHEKSGILFYGIIAGTVITFVFFRKIF